MTDLDNQFRQASDHYFEQNYEQAAALLTELCAKDKPEALSLLGLMHQLGDGVERSGEQAVPLLQRAVELGQSIAAHNLSTIYRLGMPGIEINNKLSQHYDSKAQLLESQYTFTEI